MSVSQNGATLQESLYDGAGQRLVKRAHESAQTAYFGQYLTVRDGIPATKHIFAGDVRVASKFIPNDANEECTACPDRPSVTYFHSDHLGSTAFATDEEQVLLSRQQYFPSGELWLDQADSLTAAQQPYLFSGKELDVETGLYYFGARYYDPRAGTWTTPDPILLEYMLGAPNSGVHFPRNLALYTYAINNPVVVQDTDGRAWWSKAWKVGKALYKGGDMAMAFADAIENYNTLTNASASTGERIWAGVQLLSEAAPVSVSDIKDAGRIVGVVDKIGDAGKGAKQAGNVGDAGKRLPADPPKMLPERAGPTGQISPSEVSGKTPAQIDARARELGLEARGPDPAGGRGAYIDPQTGKQRILSHPNGSPPHGHVNNPAGERIGSDGRVVPPESPEAHLPIKVE